MRPPKEEKNLAAFGKRLVQLRRSKGFTQESLAEKAEVLALTVSFIEQGRRFPRLSTLMTLARTLKTPVSEFFVTLD